LIEIYAYRSGPRTGPWTVYAEKRKGKGKEREVRPRWFNGPGLEDYPRPQGVPFWIDKNPKM
jgi:hypothetical protein